MIRYLADFIRYRELIELLTAREIKARYKQSALGILWALFQPAIMLILFSAIFTKIVRMPTGDTPYPVFLLSGLIPWLFFSNALNAAIPSLVSNADLIKKIYFPRVIFPLASIMAAAFDFLIACSLLVVLLIYFKIKLTFWLLLLPLFIFLEFMLIVSIALLLSALNVFYRDVKNALANLIQIAMFATPVIYPLSVIRPNLQKLLLLNPMTGIVECFRNVLVMGTAPNWNFFFISAILTIALFTTAHHLFKKLEPNFADSI
ncbi:MAG: hypothetical protein COV74_09020 [Candidatus Omnitrophica bacterium CG11_big_fil_rev_8_21_14_0_20_45_26]|uniref:Transport permease protein n=1 Tax=Candidatus Abzuiibacterium crystallinum TaxID=1974748 RepID=A0A2H0LLP4_9BACT|nr:MAG: hypothetical protein COV74_09020 [Candidatus Omnitrophica bacterium CG11_big_fil_rev_8_21_14_0_20_45_26]PIW63215.1 MAG: ABC transporter permease [Candidatus Omnitrophica bacterium CG12_big_fil_rev_8_21_14_0_65_45_16]